MAAAVEGLVWHEGGGDIGPEAVERQAVKELAGLL